MQYLLRHGLLYRMEDDAAIKLIQDVLDEKVELSTTEIMDRHGEYLGIPSDISTPENIKEALSKFSIRSVTWRKW